MEGFTMARRSKREYLRSIYKRYRQAQRAEKKMMLEEFCKVCGYNRKYAIWLLNRPLPETTVRKRSVPHSPTYSQAMVRVLAKVWEASGYLCSQRLKAALVHWLPWIRQHFDLPQPFQACVQLVKAADEKIAYKTVEKTGVFLKQIGEPNRKGLAWLVSKKR